MKSIAYKLVRTIENRLWSFNSGRTDVDRIIEFGKEHPTIVEYIPDKVIVPSKSSTKLFVFADKDVAIKCMMEHSNDLSGLDPFAFELWECEVENMSPYVAGVAKREEVIPDGTYLCDSVKLLEKRGDNYNLTAPQK